MTVIATYNLKGGVGKTATSINLAWQAARSGYRTLLWDLDPQGAATFYLRVQPKVKGGARALVRGDATAADQLRATDFDNLDLLPADFRYRHLDRLLDDAPRKRQVLANLLGPLADDYDVVILDCPPSISLVSENVFRAADALLVPLIPTTLSVRTLEQLADFVGQGALPGMVLLPFFTMVDRRKRLHADVMRELPHRFPELLSTYVPDASQVERMGLERAPVGEFAPGCEAAQTYVALWDEVRAKLGL